jgi:hypothetical protein
LLRNYASIRFSFLSDAIFSPLTTARLTADLLIFNRRVTAALLQMKPSGRIMNGAISRSEPREITPSNV